MEVIIDGNKFKTQEEFHQLIKKELDLPDYYGENLDALWDCLTGFIEFPVFIIWINYHQSKKLLGKEADIIAKTFEDAAVELTDLEFNKQ